MNSTNTRLRWGATVLGCLSVFVLAPSETSAALLGTYEFTDNSLAITDADGSDGITFSDLSINSYTTDQVFSDSGDAVADPTLDYMSLNGVESPNGTNSGFTNGEYFSLTITNNSGSTLNLGKMMGDFDKTTVFQQFQGRIFNTTTPGSVADDTITKLGATSGGTGLEQDEALLDGTSGEGGANWAGVPVSIADGASLTLHWVPNMNSNSTTRYMSIDNVAIFAVPEPTTGLMTLLGMVGLLTAKSRRK